MSEAEAADPSSKLKLVSITGPDARTDDDRLTAEEVKAFWDRAAAATIADPEISREVATILTLAQRIRSRGDDIDGAAERIKFALDCLLKDKPDITLAREARFTLQLDFYRKSGRTGRALARLSQSGPACVVLAALLFSMLAWLAIIVIVRVLLSSNVAPLKSVAELFFFMNDQALAIVVEAAFIGGVISIASRLGDFSRVRDLDPFAMFWTALLKPLIGVVLSIFILAALFGKIISFGFLDGNSFDGAHLNEKTKYVLWVLGFLAGFSERFAWDFVDRAEGAANGKPADDKSAQTRRA